VEEFGMSRRRDIIISLAWLAIIAAALFVPAPEGAPPVERFDPISLTAVFVSLAISAANYVVQTLISRSRTVKSGQLTGDLQFQNSTEGILIPEIYGGDSGSSPTSLNGGIRLAGNVIWAADIRKVVNKKRTSKKGPKQEETTYYTDLLISFGRGPLVPHMLEASTDVVANFMSDGSSATGIYDPDGGGSSYSTLPDPNSSSSSAARYSGTFSNLLTTVAAQLGAGGGANVAFYPGTYDQLPDSDYQAAVGSANAPAYRGLNLVKIKNFDLSKYGSVPTFFLTCSHAEIKTVGAFYEEMCDRAGLEGGDVDFSDFDSEVLRGLVETQLYRPRAAMEMLTAVKGLQVFESVDGQLVGLYLGGSTDVTVDPNHLGAFDGLEMPSDGAVPQTAEFTLIDGVQTHREITVTAFNPENKFETTAQPARLNSGDAHGQATIDLPVTLLPDEARRAAERALYVEQAARARAVMSLPPRYGYLDPTTLASLTEDGVTNRLRWTEVQGWLPGPLKVSAVRDNADAYAPALSGSNVSQPISVSFPSDTLLILIDTVTLKDSHDAPLVYVAACRVSSDGSWGGCGVYRDRGAGYELEVTIGVEATMGRAVTILPAADPAVWDETNTVDVDLYTGTLASATELQVLNGANLGILGDELIQWRSASQPDAVTYPKRWRLSGLLRGRRGSDYGCSTHAVNEKFVVLDPDSVTTIEMDLSERGVARNWKAVTDGQQTGDADYTSFTWDAGTLKPLSVVNVEGARDGSNNLTITWSRRTRVGSDAWIPAGESGPLGEEREEYSILIKNGATTVRELTATSEAVTYTAADQVTDFGSTQPSVSVEIYQVSATVGLGHVRTATV
jgi:hypothetical protein